MRDGVLTLSEDDAQHVSFFNLLFQPGTPLCLAVEVDNTFVELGGLHHELYLERLGVSLGKLQAFTELVDAFVRIGELLLDRGNLGRLAACGLRHALHICQQHE